MKVTEDYRHVLRLHEGGEGDLSLMEFVVDVKMDKGVIVCCVGKPKLTLDNVDTLIRFLENAKAELECGE